MKNFLEIFIIIGVLLYIFYLVIYTFFLTSFCDWLWWIWNETPKEILWKMVKCKDSLVCEVANVELEIHKNTVKKWTCDKKRIDYFEAGYYLDYYNDL